ncbi:MAG: DctP family TRAP transporter solute-binding subunit [Sphaerochaetaceae bacterium]|nr:DctP family TRAP transporter solute-binding subunit [Sphaerochaetaceae bacterium]
MKKGLLIILMIIGFSLIFAAGTQETDEKENFVLTFSCASVPGQIQTRAMYLFKDEIEKLTDGQITVEVYHSSSLFPQEGELDATMRGNLDMMWSSVFYTSNDLPYTSMFASAYIFEDYKHMDKVMNGEVGQKVNEDIVDELGVRILKAFYVGSRNLCLRDIGREIRTPQDMKGVNLRMPNIPAYIEIGKALGSNPTPISFSEIYTSLSTGAIDGQDNPLPTTKAAKFYEPCKYVILTHHVIEPLSPTINEEKWQSLGPELQEKMMIALETTRKEAEKWTLQEEAELVKFFEDQGLTVIEPDIDAFVDYAQNYYMGRKDLVSTWDMDLYEMVKAAAE